MSDADRLEPGTEFKNTASLHSSAGLSALVSIAISLKRIADRMDAKEPLIADQRGSK